MDGRGGIDGLPRQGPAGIRSTGRKTLIVLPDLTHNGMHWAMSGDVCQRMFAAGCKKDHVPRGMPERSERDPGGMPT